MAKKSIAQYDSFTLLIPPSFDDPDLVRKVAREVGGYVDRDGIVIKAKSEQEARRKLVRAVGRIARRSLF